MIAARKMWPLYVFLSVPLALLFVFHYMPLYGLIIAFKDFSIRKGYWRSPWNDFAHFKLFFSSPYIFRILRNTIVISLLRLVFGFPAPILLALLINEIRSMPYKRIVQSIAYLPHFMSWIVLAGIVMNVLSPSYGLVGYFYGLFGKQAPSILTDVRLFRPMLVVTEIWKEAGWGTIIYLAAMAGIDPGLYESAVIDGAGRLRAAVSITIPSILPAITVLFILSLGRILNAGFDQIFNLYSPLVYEVADIIDTYVYRIGIIDGRFDFTTAVGLFKNVVGVILLVCANAVVKRFSDYALW